ncbi:MAG: DUF4359 domain-containing protein [Ignavibacteria bacterium]|nr:DUF4359 domain-containing protein [Ignavibacteria bacterium]
MVAEKKRGYGRLIFFLAVATLFIYTNPSEKMHLDFIRESIRAEMVNESAPMGSFFINLFEVAIGEDAINSYLNNYFKRTNYVFFSLTEVKIKGECEIVAIGVLGNIIAFNDVKNGLDRIVIKLDL